MSKPMPPHNLEAERSILGAVFLDHNVIHSLDVQPGEFYLAANQSIFRTMQRLSKEGTAPDLVTISNYLGDTGEFEGLGGVKDYLSGLVDEVPTAANASYYVKIVKEKANARKVLLAAKKIAQLALSPDLNQGQLSAAAMAQIEEATIDSAGGVDLLTMEQMAEKYQDHVRKLDKSRFVTGWPDFDAVIRGVAPGEVLMITAYSGLFKSALLQNMLLNGCQRTREHHLFFSIEMPSVRVFERTCQIGLESYTYNIESGFHSREGFKAQTIEELRRIGADKLIVCDRTQVTIEQVEHLTRQARAKFGPIGAIAIDYLGLMGADGKDREYDRITHVAEHSKHLAKRLNVPVIILTQIDRNSAREGKVEKFSAKGSGAIEASADYMIGIQKDDKKNLLLKLLKNRNGEENLSFLLDIDAKYLKVRSVTAYDAIAQKNVGRGRSWLRKDLGEEPGMYTPY